MATEVSQYFKKIIENLEYSCAAEYKIVHDIKNPKNSGATK